MTDKNVVLKSINLEGDCRCVDIFRRANGTFGFGEYRREPEDGRGWFEIGLNSSQSFADADAALAAARINVRWLKTELGEH